MWSSAYGYWFDIDSATGSFFTGRYFIATDPFNVFGGPKSILRTMFSSYPTRTEEKAAIEAFKLMYGDIEKFRQM